MKKDSHFRIEETLLEGMRALAKDKRWTVTTALEVAVEGLLFSEGIIDGQNNLTEKALKLLAK